MTAAPNYPIEIIQTDRQMYNQLFFEHNQSLFTHHLWIESAQNAHIDPVYLIIRQNNQPIAKTAGLKVHHSVLRGKELYFYSAPQVETSAAFLMPQIIVSLFDFAKKQRYNRLVIASYDNCSIRIGKCRGIYPNRREDYIFDLAHPNPHELHDTRFKKNYKKSLRVNPILVENSNAEGVTNLIRLLKTTHQIRLKKRYDDYDSFYLPYTNEQVVRQAVSLQLGKIYEIRVDNQTHAVAMNLEANQSVFALFMAYDEFAYKNGLAAFFIHSLIDQYQEKGFTRYNFGGVPKGKESQGIKLFKESFGAQASKLDGLTTNFLQYPHKLLNPMLDVIRLIRKKLSE